MEWKDTEQSSSDPLIPTENRPSPAPPGTKRTTKRAAKFMPILVHLVVFMLYALAFSTAYSSYSSTGCSEQMFLGRSIPRAVAKNFSLELPYWDDDDWDSLPTRIFIRVNEKELAGQYYPSLALPGGGFLAWPVSLHQLHCLKEIRNWIYREDERRLGPPVPANDTIWVHTGHCIELIRQSLACNAGPGFVTTRWSNLTERPMLRVEGPEHKCVDWDLYMSTLMSRKVPNEELGGFRNPMFGAQ